MSDTPLSDLINSFHQSKTDEDFDALLELFKGSPIGVLAIGVKQGESEQTIVVEEGDITLASTGFGDGKSRILAFADPREFNRRFGKKSNGEMPGSSLFAAVLLNPGCAGILLNSAQGEISVVIPRERIQGVRSMAPGIADSIHQEPVRKWWEIWK